MSSRTSHAPDPLNKAMTGRFVVERCLGEGSMGAVYLAYDRARGTKVALKTLRRVDASGIYRFKREFRALADVSHTNLVELHELFSEGSDWFFTMEYVEGQDFLSYVLGANHKAEADISGRSTRTLRPQRNGNAPLYPSPLKDPERLCDVLRQVASAVCALHAAGKLHRDLKPDNVMVTADGRAVVLDFGITAERHIDPHGTMEGGVMGTPAYMSPEQARSSAVSEATDWYAFGVMLFEGLTGQVPFEGSYKEVLQQKQEVDPPSPSQLCSGVPEALDTLCVRLLSRDPEQRPTGSQVLAALGSASNVSSVSARPGAPDHRAPFVGRSHELAEIERALAATDDGSPVLLFVHGAPGMGKTALVERFLDGLDRTGTVVISGRCYEHEMVPFKALDSVVDALCRYLGSLPSIEAAEVLPKDIHALAQLFPVLRRVDVVRTARRRVALAPEPRMQRRQAIFALKELLARIATRQPLAMFIDDLQWGDIDSARVLAELMSGRDRPALLIICTYRSADKDPSPCLSTLLELMRGQHQGSVREISVGPLPEVHCVELARQLLHSGARAQAPAVARESRGNPYLLGQLVDHVHNESELESGIRVSLEHTLAERFVTLSPEAAQVLEAVAVSGRPLREQILSGLCAPLDLPACLGELRRAKLVRGVGADGARAIAIYHESLREAVLSRMEAPAIENWHRRLASALERNAPIDLEALIEHLVGSRDQSRAAIYAISAARRAYETLAFNKAAELYAIAVDNLNDDAWRQELRIAHAEALVSAGRSTRAAEVYLDAAARAPEEEASRLRLKAGTQLMLSGNVERAASAMRPALAELGVEFPASDEEALAQARPLFRELRQRGFDFVRRSESDLSKETLARLDALWGVIQATLTTRPLLAHPFALRHLREALEAGEKSRIICGLCAYFICVELAYSAPDSKPKSLQQAEVLIRDMTDPRCRAWVAFARAFAFMNDGLLKPASLDFAQAEDLFHNHCQNTAAELRSCRLLYARTLAMLGQFDELAICEQWIREALECEDLLVAARLRLYNVPRQLLEDDVAQAERALDLPEHLRSDRRGLTEMFVLLSSSQVALYRDDRAGLARVAEEMGQLGRSPMMTIRAWRSDFTLGRARALLVASTVAEDRAAALDEAERVIGKVEQIALECHADHARLLRAALHLQRGDRDRACAALDAILDDADTSGDGRIVLACARIRRGQLEGGEHGELLIRDGQHELTTRGVKEPLKFVNLYAPGF